MRIDFFLYLCNRKILEQMKMKVIMLLLVLISMPNPNFAKESFAPPIL